jgi:superfamily II DNA or RNA helicase
MNSPLPSNGCAVDLRDYQLSAVEEARAHIRAGAKNVLIVAPTGSGKTVIASHLIAESKSKGKRSAFVVDRLSLIQQTSDTFDRYGIDHGVIQGQHHRWKPHLPVQICSQQTVAKRQWPEAQLIVVDEAHTVTETITKRITPRDTIAIGLTATPFTKGLGKLYDAVVNVTTTNRLIEQGFLSNYTIYSCIEPDMEGVKIIAGEFDEVETSKRALKVVGDVVQEYIEKGDGRKFICSAVDTAHVVELQRQFLSAGINAATYTYKDREEDRADTVVEFRKHDSTIRGLITVTAASKGFDVPDIGCVIMARPLSKSLAEHIQFFGRGLRIAEGKDNCIVLDHSGNSARFWTAWNHFFEHGLSELDDGKRKPKPKLKEKDEEEEMMKCPHCRAMHAPRPVCPACGHEYPRKKAIEHVPGTLKELVATGNVNMIRKALWPQVVALVLESTDDMERAQRKAQGIYHTLTGTFAHARVEFTTPIPPTIEVRNKVKANAIRYAKGRARATA